jgi:hypothetical protein
MQIYKVHLFITNGEQRNWYNNKHRLLQKTERMGKIYRSRRNTFIPTEEKYLAPTKRMLGKW